MPFLPHKCPHCEIDQVSLEVVALRKISEIKVAVSLACPNQSCLMPSCAIVESGQTIIGHVMAGARPNLLSDKNLRVTSFFPVPVISQAPEFVPDNVARVFIQAMNAQRQKSYDIAMMGYRKALDVALKEFDENVSGDFNARIKKLAERHDLTPAMRDWSDEVRLLGNAAAHEGTEPSGDDVADLAALTQSTLEYLFTMPQRVEVRRAKRSTERAAKAQARQG